MKRVLVYGGKGALGSTLLKAFKKRGNWHTICVDVNKNEEAHWSLIIPKDKPWLEQASVIESELVSKQEEKLDAIVCVAGGWAGGNAMSKDLLKNSEDMWKASVQPSMHAAHLAATLLRENGLLLLPGAAASTGPTPGMLGYGVAKAAVHHLVRSLASQGSGLPKSALVAGFMPVTLDTEMNRKSMPNADFSMWTPLEELSNKIVDWCDGKDRPGNGKLVRLVTKNYKTEYIEE